MKLDAHQFQQHLAKTLLPIYIISGDDQLLREEARQQLREQAAASGFSERIVLHSEAQFKWGMLENHFYSGSLFADKQYIELNWHKGSFPKDASPVLKRYLDQIDPNKIFCLVLPKLEASVTKTQWFKKLSNAAGVLTLWPISRQQLPQWIQQRMRANALVPKNNAETLLAEAAEGNLLATAQTIEKLSLLYRPVDADATQPTPISPEQLNAALDSSAEFSIFDWVHYLMLGDIRKGLRIYHELVASGTEPVLMLWAITKEIRLLLKLKPHRRNNPAMNKVFSEHKVWKQRQGPLLKACNRISGADLTHALLLCQQLDCAIKGLSFLPQDTLFQQLMMCLGETQLAAHWRSLSRAE